MSEGNRMILGSFQLIFMASSAQTSNPGPNFSLRQSTFFSLNPTKKSRVISKLSQLLAMLGATFIRFGTMPLYNPRNPSCLIITVIASQIDLYWYPIPLIVLIWKRRRRTSLPIYISINQTRVRLSNIGTETVQWICAGLGNSTGDGAGSQFSVGRGVLFAFRGEVLSHRFIRHEVQSHLRRISADNLAYGQHVYVHMVLHLRRWG